MATILCKDLATAAAAASSTDHLTRMVFFYRMLVSKVWTVSECSCDDDDASVDDDDDDEMTGR